MADIHSIAPPTPQRTCRLLHKNGLAFDFIVSQVFDLGAVITSIRANGFLLIAGQCYIPEDQIGMMFMLQGEAPAAAQIIPFPDKTS